MKNISLISLLISLLLSACNPNKVYQKQADDFEQGVWKANEAVNFELKIEETFPSLKAKVLLRHIYGFAKESLPLQVTVTTPSGEKKQQVVEIKVRENGEYLSSCAGDYCDLTAILLQEFPTQKGTYQISIAQGETLSGILSIGILIEK